MNKPNLMSALSLDTPVVELADQDDHWHFVTQGVILGG